MGRRIFNFVAAFFGVVVLSPVLLLVAILIKLTDPGPILFKQERVGERGKRFKIFKFRTMIVDAERVGKQITVGSDPRITKVGAILRKTKMDELPQLFNVLRGEMGFVGPRPEVPRYVDLYTPEQRKVLDLIPGITDPASIKYRDESELLAEAEDPEAFYINTIMPDKIRLNLEYGEHAGVLADIGIILKTLLKLFR